MPRDWLMLDPRVNLPRPGSGPALQAQKLHSAPASKFFFPQRCWLTLSKPWCYKYTSFTIVFPFPYTFIWQSIRCFDKSFLSSQNGNFPHWLRSLYKVPAYMVTYMNKERTVYSIFNGNMNSRCRRKTHPNLQRIFIRFYLSWNWWQSLGSKISNALRLIFVQFLFCIWN